MLRHHCRSHCLDDFDDSKQYLEYRYVGPQHQHNSTVSLYTCDTSVRRLRVFGFFLFFRVSALSTLPPPPRLSLAEPTIRRAHRSRSRPGSLPGLLGRSSLRALHTSANPSPNRLSLAECRRKRRRTMMTCPRSTSTRRSMRSRTTRPRTTCRTRMS